MKALLEGRGKEREEGKRRGRYRYLGSWRGKGKVRVEMVEDLNAESLLRATIKKVKRGSLISTDRFRSDDGLVMYGLKQERVDHSQRFRMGGYT